MENETKAILNKLCELSKMMHPHLGEDNHTYRLILVLYTNKTKLASRDFFDLGKYYDRMMGLIETNISEDKRYDYVSAVLNMKHRCYGAYQASALS